MDRNTLINAIGLIDDDIISEANAVRSSGAVKSGTIIYEEKAKSRKWVKWVVIAACAVLVAVAIPVAIMIKFLTTGAGSAAPQAPEISAAAGAAEDGGKYADGMDEGSCENAQDDLPADTAIGNSYSGTDLDKGCIPKAGIYTLIVHVSGKSRFAEIGQKYGAGALIELGEEYEVESDGRIYIVIPLSENYELLKLYSDGGAVLEKCSYSSSASDRTDIYITGGSFTEHGGIIEFTEKE